MDRDSWTANIDNIVVVDAGQRRLVWIPRDLWSRTVGDRINAAYERGGHELLHSAVRDLGLPAESSVVLLRSAVERVLEGLSVTVPVDRRRRYWYPLAPTHRLQDGRKLIGFDPPRETLSGERIHQWVGARRSADVPPPALPDIDRIERQQVLVRTLLEDGFDFSRALEDSDLVSVSGSRVLDELTAVRADWDFQTHERFRPATVEGKMVLVPHHRLLPSRRRRSCR